MLGADRSGSVHNTPRFTITTATTTAPHTFIKKPAILYTFTSYLENVTCGSSHLFSGLLRGWSSLVEHHPASASATRSVRSLTAAPRNEHNSSHCGSLVRDDPATPRPTVTDIGTKEADAAASVCSRWEGGEFEPNVG